MVFRCISSAVRGGYLFYSADRSLYNRYKLRKHVLCSRHNYIFLPVQPLCFLCHAARLALLIVLLSARLALLIILLPARLALLMVLLSARLTLLIILLSARLALLVVLLSARLCSGALCASCIRILRSTVADFSFLQWSSAFCTKSCHVLYLPVLVFAVEHIFPIRFKKVFSPENAKLNLHL